MLQAFIQHIQQHALFNPADTILLTVSGGIDSVVMCELFHQSELRFAIAHCNFGLRDAESDGDETFVEALAEKYDVPFHSTSFATAAFAKKNKLSMQAAARQLRYEWFEEVRKHYKYTCMATAHHRGDSVETFFINLLRGTGIAGLHGILPKQGKIIRPLLFADKESITAFAKKNKLKHRDDSSNASDKYLRNNIRHSLIPALKKLNPAVESTIESGMQHLHDVEIIYREAVEKKRKKILREEKNGFSLSITELKKLHPLRTYLYEFLKPFHFNSAIAEEIANALDEEPGKQFFSPTHRLVKDRKLLLVEEKNKQPVKSIAVSAATKTLPLGEGTITFRTLARKPDFVLPASATMAALDFNKLEFPLEIRGWQKGDAFQPIGMKGRKKLSDLFTDKKLSLSEKENVRVLVSQGEIVWVIGLRPDERFKIGAQTTKIYFVELKP